jgi:hypothetical protein
MAARLNIVVVPILFLVVASGHGNPKSAKNTKATTNEAIWMDGEECLTAGDNEGGSFRSHSSSVIELSAKHTATCQVSTGKTVLA